VFDKHYSIPHLFGESISFINSALEKGNVLVHCERGQYRSPTVYVAWLINRGMNTSEAISFIGGEYEGWADKYWKNRPLYIDKLKLFEKKKSTIISYWSKKNIDLISAWKDRKIPEKKPDPIQKAPPKRKRDNESLVPPKRIRDNESLVPPKRKRDNESLVPPNRIRDNTEETNNQNDNDIVFKIKQK